MALVQAGMGLTRVMVLVGAGVAGSVVLRNGRLAEILGELQEILDKGSKGKDGGGADGEADVNEALTSQGAYTGVCSQAHVPSYNKNIDKLKAKGIDFVICVAVNDPYVLNGWAEKLEAKDAVAADF